MPFTHKTALLPSSNYVENNMIVPNVSAGSAIVFDSMLLHRAGMNVSSTVRRGVNHVYARPILKQQYDFSEAIGERTFSEDIMRLLGKGSRTMRDDKAWRQARTSKLKDESS